MLQECLDEVASFLLEYAGKTWPGQGQRTKDAVYVSTVQYLSCVVQLPVSMVVDKGLGFLIFCQNGGRQRFILSFRISDLIFYLLYNVQYIIYRSFFLCLFVA